jgi:protein TonB
LADESAPDQALEFDGSDFRMSTQLAIVVADTTRSPETAFQNLARPRLPRRAKSDPQLPDTHRPLRKTVRPRPERAIELADAEIEIPYTIQSEQSAGAEVPPSFVSRPLPAYPAELLLRRIEGTVELFVTIGADGHVAKAELHRSSGYPAMDRSALKTICRWTFTPARRGDAPIAKRAIVPIDFTIPQ